MEAKYSEATPARTPPAGGPAMMNGVAYQLLWSLLRFWKETVCKATVRDVLKGPTDLEPRGVTVILEPPEGGDLEISGAVEQIKTRSNGGPWSLEEVIRDVLPDLYKACRAREKPMSYCFVTEGFMGQWEDVYEFFRSLGARAIQGSNPLAALDDQQAFASAKKNLKLAQKIREAGGAYTERGIFLHIARVLTGEGKENKRKRTVQDPPDVLYRNLLRLLGSFEFQGGQQWPVVEGQVLCELSARGAKRTEQTLDALVGGLLRRARKGGAIVEREYFLAQYNLQAIPLRSWDLIIREGRLFLEKTLKLQGYRASEDCRERRPLLNLLQAENGEPVVAWGESGQGKSWLIYGTAEELARRDEAVLLLDSTQDVLRDRNKAARLFCEQIGGTDERYSLDQLAKRVREQLPERSGRWLTVLIDGVRDRDYLKTLVRQEWEAIGVRVAVALTTDTKDPGTLEKGVLPLSVGDFSQREVLRYLRFRLGDGMLLPPEAILRLLRHPLWARLFCDLVAGGGRWQSNNEYQLIEGYWIGQAAHAPITTDALTELASRLIEDESYPFSLAQLRGIGIGELELERLIETHLVRWAHGGRTLELWHERILHWAIAEGLVSGLRANRLTSEELRNRVRTCNVGAGGRRFGYVPMDVLWLLADPTDSREEDILGLLRLFEEHNGLFVLVATIGGRIVPHIFARLRQITGKADYLEIRYLEMLESMEEASIAGFAIEMLNESDVRLQKVAARILATHGDSEALDRLWALYREWSAEIEARDGAGSVQGSEIGFHDVVQADKALGSCVHFASGWLEQAIRTSDAETDPVHTLVFLIPRVKQGRELWQRVKRVAFEKVRPPHERSLAACIARFLDRVEVPWLVERVNRRENSLAPMARKGLYLLSPESALRRIDPGVAFDLAAARFWWLRPLQNEYSQEASELVFEAIRAAEKPWVAALFYDGLENWMNEEALELLLDATDDLLARELAEPSPANAGPLHRPLARLSSICHPNLLKLFWRRPGTNFERNLTAWLIREGPWEEGWHRHDLEAGVSILGRIAGEGIIQVANSYLERATIYWGRKAAFDLALRYSDERTIELLTQVAFQEQEHSTGTDLIPLDQSEALRILADDGHVDVVVRGIVRWGMQLSQDFAAYLGRRIIGNEELAPALKAFAVEPVPPGAILALGMSGRPEMEDSILSLLERANQTSQLALACLLALEILETRSEASKQAFVRACEVPDHRFFARRALARFETEQDTDERRTEDARWVWARRGLRWQLFEKGESLETLSHLDTEEVREYLRERALSEGHEGWEPSGKFDAVRALMKLDPDSAFEAARHQIARGAKKQRNLYPNVLIEVDEARAEREFADLLREDDDFVLIYSIGEALDQTGKRPLLLRWLGDSEPRLREGACIVAEAMRWSPDLDEALFALRRDEDWDAREASWQALERIRLQREVDRLIVAFQDETDRARRWCLLDAALDLGYPGVVRGYGRFGWFLALQETEGLPYSMRKYAVERLEKRREALVKELEKRKRD